MFTIPTSNLKYTHISNAFLACQNELKLTFSSLEFPGRWMEGGRGQGVCGKVRFQEGKEGERAPPPNKNLPLHHCRLPSWPAY